MIRGGLNYVSSAPAFSKDGKRLFVCSGTSVSVFSTATGSLVSSLQGHTAVVTAVVVIPTTASLLSYCWTASVDGTIRQWDYSVPECVKILDLRFPIFSLVVPSALSTREEKDAKSSPNVIAYVSVESRNAQDNRPKPRSGQIRKCNLTNFHTVSSLILRETEQPESLTISPSGKFLGIKDKRKLHIWKVPKMDSDSAVSKKITLHHTKTFTVLAFHPTERIVAAGDVTGRILIWRGFGAQKFLNSSVLVNGRPTYNDDKPGVRENDDAESCCTWHWHSSGVSHLSFSSDGAYLYSGGKEGVLLLWQLDTGNKKFLPRIGSPLLYFVDSPDSSLSALSCADNQIHILKMPSMEIIKSISGIKPPLSSQDICEGLSSRVSFDCTSGSVAVQTESYRIQFYSLFANRGVYEVQVCERNHQPVDEITLVVSLVELSLDGSVMGTVEIKLPEDGIGGLVCLKFWDLDDNQRFSVSTLIYEPHRDAHISAVAFHPTRHMAVSSSYGGDFKVWVCKEEIELKGQMLQTSGWMCHAVGSYKNKAMRAAAFSADGSVLAVAADTVITLWDPNNNVLVAVIGETPMPITRLVFAGSSDYLLSVSHGSKPQLSVWSMSKLAASWSYRLQIEAVSSAIDLSYFAALVLLPESNDCTFKGDGIILLFNVKDPVPVASWSVSKAKGGGLAFLKGEPSESAITDGRASQALLVYINGDREYVIFHPYGKEARELSITGHEDRVFEETGQSGYTSIYGALPKFDWKRNIASPIPSAASERPWETIFSGSSHSLPPLTKLCSEFLESLLEKRTTAVE
ncbi:WD repeat-containing protein 75 [Vigna radiata var. radiata]|uniref:WD repeat-containing protein 75 n=1 Tax=Vigna radiata var. radiata TaxID=3916 RepID=A0A1S3UV28_VIGRR|nr:WD repeat-containing protein 75 [Vigna radiata var. radiata]